MLIIFGDGQCLDMVPIEVIKKVCHDLLEVILHFIMSSPRFEADHGDEPELQSGDGDGEKNDLSWKYSGF